MKTPAIKAQGASRDQAETLAISALSFLAAEPDRLGVFLALSGIGPELLRAAASEPHFLSGVLDHIAGNEQLLVAFAAHADIDPADVARAQSALAGPQRDAP